MGNITERVVGKKIVFPRAFELAYETAEWPAAALDRQVLIRTEYSLISPGTELAFYTGTHIDLNNPANKWAKLPFYPGYASVGTVVAAGQAVRTVVPGDRVFTLGHHATYDVLDEDPDSVMKLPPGLASEKALFARMAEISMSALIHSRFQAGARVAVIGMGLVGNLAAQLYAIQGAQVIGVDVVERRLDIARQTGIGHTVLSGENVDLAQEVKRWTGEALPDIVVEATGNPALINVALGLVRRHGQVILLGSPRGKTEIDVYRHIHSKGVSLIGAHAGIKGFDGLPSSADALRYVMDLIHRNQLSVEPLHTHTLLPDQAGEAYELLLNSKENALGILLDWRRSS